MFAFFQSGSTLHHVAFFFYIYIAWLQWRLAVMKLEQQQSAAEQGRFLSSDLVAYIVHASFVLN